MCLRVSIARPDSDLTRSYLTARRRMASAVCGCAVCGCASLIAARTLVVDHSRVPNSYPRARIILPVLPHPVVTACEAVARA
jgi:hypothetical protein